MFRWQDHTSELELAVEASTAEEVFADATAALGSLLRDGDGRSTSQRVVCASAGDPAGLLAEWLSELLFLAETEGFVPERLDEIELLDGAVTGTVSGLAVSPRPIVKGVTYHDLRFERDGKGWRATVVLDV